MYDDQEMFVTLVQIYVDMRATKWYGHDLQKLFFQSHNKYAVFSHPLT